MKYAAFAVLLAVSLLARPAAAQTLSLSPLVTAAASDGTVMFTVLLADGTNDTSNLGAYNFTVLVDKQYLSFVSPTAPFTANAGAGFTNKFVNAANNSTGTMQVNYSIDFGAAGVNEEGQPPLTLGTFSVKVLQPLPVAGTLLSFANVGTGLSQSAIFDNTSNANVLQSTQGARILPLVAPAPEPSGALALLTGAGALFLLAAKRRAQA